jgi:tripartite-type tricarboxylate transporter receptor subunit TctC
MDDNRLMGAPEMPAVDEAGVPGLYMSNWYALFAPRGHLQGHRCQA